MLTKQDVIKIIEEEIKTALLERDVTDVDSPSAVQDAIANDDASQAAALQQAEEEFNLPFTNRDIRILATQYLSTINRAVESENYKLAGVLSKRMVNYIDNLNVKLNTGTAAYPAGSNKADSELSMFYFQTPDIGEEMKSWLFTHLTPRGGGTQSHDGGDGWFKIHLAAIELAKMLGYDSVQTSEFPPFEGVKYIPGCLEREGKTEEETSDPYYDQVAHGTGASGRGFDGCDTPRYQKWKKDLEVFRRNQRGGSGGGGRQVLPREEADKVKQLIASAGGYDLMRKASMINIGHGPRSSQETKTLFAHFAEATGVHAHVAKMSDRLSDGLASVNAFALSMNYLEDGNVNMTMDGALDILDKLDLMVNDLPKHVKWIYPVGEVHGVNQEFKNVKAIKYELKNVRKWIGHIKIGADGSSRIDIEGGETSGGDIRVLKTRLNIIRKIVATQTSPIGTDGFRDRGNAEANIVAQANRSKAHVKKTVELLDEITAILSFMAYGKESSLKKQIRNIRSAIEGFVTMFEENKKLQETFTRWGELIK